MGYFTVWEYKVPFTNMQVNIKLKTIFKCGYVRLSAVCTLYRPVLFPNAQLETYLGRSVYMNIDQIRGHSNTV